MMGVIRTVCAITIAPGVNSRPYEPSGPERDNSKIDDQPDDDRRQSHHRVEEDDEGVAAGNRPTAIAAPSGRPSQAAR